MYLITFSSRQWDVLGSSCCSFTGQTHLPLCGNNSNICAALRDDSIFFMTFFLKEEDNNKNFFMTFFLKEEDNNKNFSVKKTTT